ncbi:MAG TPA: acetolactate synthase large subunit, partial [Thermoplasmata archaeon]|nr:acetolactate synthase large subunit [Thermoplasmata archaeon]
RRCRGMNAAQLLIACLESEGVRFAFGIPGEENLELMDALRGSSVRFVLTRHEGAAAFMADVYGRLSGRAGVCLATLGPGATNLVTGVADAFLDRAPLVAITAQANLSKIHRESHQYVDILQLFSRITKWNARVESPDVVPEIVRKAFKLAEAEKPGSTHIELPENVAGDEAEPHQKPLPREPVSAPTPARASVEQAALLIEKAKKPIILAGNGVIRNGSSTELTEFAERLQIPVVTTVMGKGAIPWTSPMSLLTIGILPRDYELAGFEDSDLVICIGYDFVEYDPRTWNSGGDRRIVHIDALPAEISAHYLPEVEVIGEIRESVQALGQRVRKTRTSSRSVPSSQTIRKTLESELGVHGEKLLNPRRILWSLRDLLEPDDLLISDVGAHKLWLSRFFRVVKPKTVIISNGLSPMGIALPGGIAAKLLDPDRRVVTLSGDGGFIMSVHELETARRERAATVNLVFRDGGLGSIRWKQMAKFQRTVGTDFGNPDFQELAKAFGVRGFEVNHPSELNSVLAEAFESNAPCVVDIPVDYGENPFLDLRGSQKRPGSL